MLAAVAVASIIEAFAPSISSAFAWCTARLLRATAFLQGLIMLAALSFSRAIVSCALSLSPAFAPSVSLVFIWAAAISLRAQSFLIGS